MVARSRVGPMLFGKVSIFGRISRQATHNGSDTASDDNALDSIRKSSLHDRSCASDSRDNQLILMFDFLDWEWGGSVHDEINTLSSLHHGFFLFTISFNQGHLVEEFAKALPEGLNLSCVLGVADGASDLVGAILKESVGNVGPQVPGNTSDQHGRL